MKLITAAIVLAALVLPSNASAYDWLPRFEKASVAYWGRPGPPCGKITYSWVAADVTQGFGAQADPPTCAIRFNVDIWHQIGAPTMCMIVAHEIGHLYGHEHTATGVMAPSIESGTGDWESISPCRKTITEELVYHLSTGILTDHFVPTDLLRHKRVR